MSASKKRSAPERRPRSAEHNKTPGDFTATSEPGEQLSFLPPAPFAPTLPTKGTLSHHALRLFAEGRMLEHPDFEALTGSWRLGAVVFTLRALGWPVETLDIPAPTDECPQRTIARYHLAGKHLAEATALLRG